MFFRIRDDETIIEEVPNWCPGEHPYLSVDLYRHQQGYSPHCSRCALFEGVGGLSKHFSLSMKYPKIGWLNSLACSRVSSTSHATSIVIPPGLAPFIRYSMSFSSHSALVSSVPYRSRHSPHSATASRTCCLASKDTLGRRCACAARHLSVSPDFSFGLLRIAISSPLSSI